MALSRKSPIEKPKAMFMEREVPRGTLKRLKFGFYVAMLLLGIAVMIVAYAKQATDFPFYYVAIILLACIGIGTLGYVDYMYKTRTRLATTEKNNQYIKKIFLYNGASLGLATFIAAIMIHLYFAPLCPEQCKSSWLELLGMVLISLMIAIQALYFQYAQYKHDDKFPVAAIALSVLAIAFVILTCLYYRNIGVLFWPFITIVLLAYGWFDFGRLERDCNEFQTDKAHLTKKQKRDHNIEFWARIIINIAIFAIAVFIFLRYVCNIL